MEARLAAAIEGSSRRGGVTTLIVPLPDCRPGRSARAGPRPPSLHHPLLLSRLVGLRAQPSLGTRDRPINPGPDPTPRTTQTAPSISVSEHSLVTTALTAPLV